MNNTLTSGMPGKDHPPESGSGTPAVPAGLEDAPGRNSGLAAVTVAALAWDQRASQGRASRADDSNISACTNACGRLPRS